jgi:type II secretory pathway pseudopilin PulG
MDQNKGIQKGIGITESVVPLSGTSRVGKRSHKPPPDGPARNAFAILRLNSLPKRSSGMTLMELLIVIILMGALAVTFLSGIHVIASRSQLGAAADKISGALQLAAVHARAHQTYTWVGFFEEDPASPPGIPQPGTGRLVVGIFASKDGTVLYDPGEVQSPGRDLDSDRIVQLGKLLKLDRVRLITAKHGETLFPIGSGEGETFLTRPTVASTTAQIGDTSPNPSLIRIPLCEPGHEPQYVFTKLIQFSPRGEARVNNTNYTIKPVIEIGLGSVKGLGNQVISPDVVAIQVAGFTANVNVYRR